jgi:hypothetical protein
MRERINEMKERMGRKVGFSMCIKGGKRKRRYIKGAPRKEEKCQRTVTQKWRK